MNRDALDEFFARADDVLADWEPSDDAMVARAVDEDAELPLADSYYVQGQPFDVTAWIPLGWWVEYNRFIADQLMSYGRSFFHVGVQGIVTLPMVTGSEIQTMRDGILSLAREVTPEAERDEFADFERRWLAEHCDVMPKTPEITVPPVPTEDRPAVRVLQHNTGPRSRVGLDGHFRR